MIVAKNCYFWSVFLQISCGRYPPNSSNFPKPHFLLTCTYLPMAKATDGLAFGLTRHCRITPVLQSATLCYKVLQSITPVLQSTIPILIQYYKTPVLLRLQSTTLYYSSPSTTPVLRQYYSVLKVLLGTTKYQ